MPATKSERADYLRGQLDRQVQLHNMQGMLSDLPVSQPESAAYRKGREGQPLAENEEDYTDEDFDTLLDSLEEDQH